MAETGGDSGAAAAATAPHVMTLEGGHNESSSTDLLERDHAGPKDKGDQPIVVNVTNQIQQHSNPNTNVSNTSSNSNKNTNHNKATAHAHASAHATAMAGGCGGGFGMWFWQTKTIMIIAFIISLLCMSMTMAAIVMAKWETSTFNGGLVIGTGGFDVGILEYCIYSDDDQFDDECFDRSELNRECDRIYATNEGQREECSDWVDSTWTILVCLLLTLGFNIICATASFMTISCLVPHHAALWQCESAISVLQFINFIVYLVALITYGAAETNFFKPVRNDILEEAGLDTSQIVFRDPENDSSFDLVVASLIFTIILWLLTSSLRYSSRRRNLRRHNRRGRFVGFRGRGCFV